MVFASGFTLKFWGDAAKHAAYILNRSPIKENEVDISPIQMLTKIRPVLSDIVVFGSPSTVHLNIKNKIFERVRERGINIGKGD